MCFFLFKSAFAHIVKERSHLLNREMMLRAPAPAINNIAIVYGKWEVFSRLDWKSLIKGYFTDCGSRSYRVRLSQEEVGIKLG